MDFSRSALLALDRNTSLNHTLTTRTGYQVIAQLSEPSEVHKLYTNQSTAPLTPVTVLVERDGVYQVTIFAIRGGRGILDSDVMYTQQVMVDSSNLSTDPANTTTPAIPGT